MTDLVSLEASVRQEAAAGTKGDRIPAAYVAEVFDALRAAEAARDAALKRAEDAEAKAARPLDQSLHLSCGHSLTLRHTACPTCLAEMRTELAAALKERDEARATAKALNRRAQEAEAAVREKVKASSGSLGRALANAAASMYRRDLEAERARGDRMAEALRGAVRLGEGGTWVVFRVLTDEAEAKIVAALREIAAPSPDAAKEGE